MTQPRLCKKCGAPIVDRLPTARYCSIECQEKRNRKGYEKPKARRRRHAVFPAWKDVW